MFKFTVFNNTNMTAFRSVEIAATQASSSSLQSPENFVGTL
jgi:hypothetical protein